MDHSAPRSSSRPRPSSRPTTPLRPSSRSSVRGHEYSVGHGSAGYNALEPQFAELADSMADLEANFMHLQLMHESLTRFSESFASFIYGLNMNAFCVDFPEAPIAESFRRAKEGATEKEVEPDLTKPSEGDMTFMTTDTTFVENPPSTASSKPASKTTSRGTGRGTSTRGSTTSRYATRGSSRGRPSALPRGKSTR
ncbi:DASH complex subunit Dam1-domain-containing protein [Aspergillus karnatakaensis]|uniref:DASH complex subunit DAM1 n=1 Tax=Aspergillus karnatakaensis TaxID=1810916 RepID=UPI003CCC9DE5